MEEVPKEPKAREEGEEEEEARLHLNCHHLIGGPYGPGRNLNDRGAAPTRLVGEGDMRRHHSSGFVRSSPLKVSGPLANPSEPSF